MSKSVVTVTPQHKIGQVTELIIEERTGQA
jgi:hypothetical protein